MELLQSWISHRNEKEISTIISLTKLSSRFAIVEANLCSPASSEIRNTYSHGGYPGNRNVRYGSHNMADAQGAKYRHVYFSIKTAFNKMI